MSKQELLDALKSEQAMAEYLEVRDDNEIIADVRSIVPPSLTKRDYFAAAALPAVISAVYTGGIVQKSGLPMTEKTVAEQALLFADAMIAASKSEADHG